MEEDEEAHTAVDKAMATTAYKVDAEDTITLERAAILKEDCATLLAPACLNTARIWQQTKQDHHGRNSCNTLAQIRDKT